MTIADRCPDCGAMVEGGRDGCQALWHVLSFAPEITAEPAFDAYCMQHLETYCRSAKSYAAHLTRLCCGIEHNGDPRIYTAIQQWLNGNRILEKPPLLAFLGDITIADVQQSQTPAERRLVTRAWVQSVWAAYTPQHSLARTWIKEALADKAMRA